MVLEATVVCLDNSEWMRNGDYPPTRFQAQTDAVNLICGAKTQANPENTVGVLSMAGKGVRILVTPTADLGAILSSLHSIDIGGQSNVLSAVQVAQLALKHRQNKNQRQRIVLFSGSPVAADVDTLVKIGKKLKKNNVALDIVSFGEEDDGKEEKLQALLAAVNSNDNSHLVLVPPGPAMLSDVLISSPIFTGDGEGGSGFAAAAAAGSAAVAAAGGHIGGDYDFGVDPNLDPELALALRVSMEEERARQEAAARRAAAEQQQQSGRAEGVAAGAEQPEAKDQPMAEGEKSTLEAAAATPATAAGTNVNSDTGTLLSAAATGTSAEPPPLQDDIMEDESALLQKALEMSLGEAAAAAAAAAAAGAAAPMDTSAGPTTEGKARETPGGGAGGVEDDDLTLALQMSLDAGQGGAGRASADAAVPNVLEDTALLNSILASLPGVDPNDPSVREVLDSLQGSRDQGGRTGDKKEQKEGEGQK